MTHQPLNSTKLPTGVWEEVAVDLFKLKGRHFTLFVDYFSWWIEVQELMGQTGQEVASKTKPIFARWDTQGCIG